VAGTIGQPIEAPLQVPGDVNANDHSEAMLHKLDDFKKMMAKDRLGFLYERWRNHSCADPARRDRWKSQPVFGEGWQEKEDNAQGGLWQLKIINWGMMWGARGRLNNLHTSAEALGTASDQVFQKIHAAWTSKAGDAAAGKFNDLRAAARDYADQLQTLGAQMDGAWKATRHAIEKLADFANQDDVGGKPLVSKYGGEGNSDDAGNEKRGQMSKWIDEIDEAMKTGTYRWGPAAHEVIGGNGDGGIYGHVVQTPETVRWAGQVFLTEGDNTWANETCNWLDDMCECYFLTAANFRRRVEETINEVKTNWENLNSKSTGLPGDPFGKLSMAASEPPPEKKKDDSKPKDHNTGGGSKATGDTGGGTVSTGSGSTSTPPPVDTATTPAAEPVPGGGTVDTGNGQQPGTPGRQQPDTVTIQDGDRKISVQSPDGQGHVKVTVDDGSGQPKGYDLDFSAGTGQPDGQAQPLPATDQPEPGGAQQVKAGPDGKAVVQDGATTITAEQPPGSTDQVKITIDDGTGKPTTYLVDYANPGDGAQLLPATDTQQASGGAHGFAGTGQPVTVEPLPAEPVKVGFAEPVPAEPLPAEPVNAGFVEPVAAEPLPAEPVNAGFVEPLPAEPVNAGFVEPADAGFSEPQAGAESSVWSEPSQDTTPQSNAFSFGDGASHGGAAEDGPWSAQGDLLAGPDQQEVAPAGEAGLAAVPDDRAGHPQAQGATPMGGGMPMMGGMSAGGGGDGGDQERGASVWRTQGDLFDDGPREDAADRISAVLGDDR
jgi:uncharacterized protein YukE